MKKYDKVEDILKKHPAGLSITEIVLKCKFSRFTVRTVLAKLEGGNKVKIRNVGMAKLYILNK